MRISKTSYDAASEYFLQIEIRTPENQSFRCPKTKSPRKQASGVIKIAGQKP
jgi:hypothetical protein